MGFRWYTLWTFWLSKRAGNIFLDMHMKRPAEKRSGTGNNRRRTISHFLSTTSSTNFIVPKLRLFDYHCQLSTMANTERRLSDIISPLLAFAKTLCSKPTDVVYKRAKILSADRPTPWKRPGREYRSDHSFCGAILHITNHWVAFKVWNPIFVARL